MSLSVTSACYLRDPSEKRGEDAAKSFFAGKEQNHVAHDCLVRQDASAKARADVRVKAVAKVRN